MCVFISKIFIKKKMAVKSVEIWVENLNKYFSKKIQMDNKIHKVFNFMVVWTMNIKMTSPHNFIHLQMTKMKKISSTECWWKSGAMRPPYNSGLSGSRCSLFWKLCVRVRILTLKIHKPWALKFYSRNHTQQKCAYMFIKKHVLQEYS